MDLLPRGFERGDWSGFSQYLDKVCASPSSGKNALELVDSRAFHKVVIESIDSAKESIDVMMFEVEDDEVTEEVFDAMIEKAKETKVSVRALFDAHGFHPSPSKVQEMKEAGIHVLFRPAPLFRGHLDHRKLWVIDGKKAYVGGMNLGLSYHQLWRDQQTLILGPAVARLEHLFTDAWASASGADLNRAWRPGTRAEASISDGAETHVVNHEGGFADENIKLAYLRAIRTSTERIRIATPFFGDKDIVDALLEARKRGVEVELYLPRENVRPYMLDAARVFYEELLSEGVQIFEQTECMVHLKVASFDGRVATVGSSNLDARSMEYNNELNLFVIDESFTAEVDEQIFGALRRESELVTSVPEDSPTGAWQYVLKKAMFFL